MKIGQNEVEHQSSIINAMLNDTAKRYFKYAKLNTDTDETGILSKLSRDAGYLFATNLVSIKILKQEKRIKALEDKQSLAINMHIFEDPQSNLQSNSQLEQYR